MGNVVDISREGSIGILNWKHEKLTNPINFEMEGLIKDALIELDSNESVKVIILTGGNDRSFSAGGDFEEVRRLRDPNDVDQWIDRVIDLYTSILKVRKLTIAAVDNYAIGIGFQMALSCDLRISSPRASFVMPELKHGISCTIGQFMLSQCIGRIRMQNLVFGCKPISGSDAFNIGLIDEIISSENDFLINATEYAERFVSYPDTSLLNTKKVINKDFINNLIAIGTSSKIAHRESFGKGTAQMHFNNILTKNKAATV